MHKKRWIWPSCIWKLIGTYPRWKRSVSLIRWYPRRFLRKYGTYQQCSSNYQPDARSIVIKPWDKSTFRVIEKAIIDSDLGIMPENNGEMIRIGIPPLTEERRKQLAKQCKGEGETAKVQQMQRAS